MDERTLTIAKSWQPSRRLQAPNRRVEVPLVLSVTMLGRLAACDAAGNDLLPRVRKTRAVLAILALAAPEPVPRSRLIALLWSRRQPPQAQGSLRQALLELRLALGDAARLLRTAPGYLALSDDGLRVDVAGFLRARSPRPDENVQPSDCQPLSLAWQGHMLDDLVGLDPGFDQWLGDQRRELWRRMRVHGEIVLAEAQGTAASTLAAERLLTIDAAHEGAWRALINGHIARGDRAAAVDCYERCCSALATQSEVGPSAETLALIAPLRARSDVVSDTVSGRITPLVSSPRRTGRNRVRLGVTNLRASSLQGTAELAAGLAEELIVALSRFRWLGCILCATDQKDCDVDFLLGGAVQRCGDRLRVLLRLADLRAASEVVWAERFDFDISEIFTLQEQLASTTAARLEPRLWLWEAERIGACDSSPRTAQELLRLAVPAVYRLDRRHFMSAGRLLDQSIELDPDDAAAHAWAAHWHIFAVGQGWAPNPSASIERGRGLAERAIQLDPEDARGLSLAGHVWSFIDRRPDEALSLHERAIKMNPGVALSWCLSGLAHTYVGQCDIAIGLVHHAQVLSPGDPLSYFFEMTLAVAHLLRGDPSSAAQAAQRAVLLNPSFSSAYKALLAALGHLGRREAAAEARATLLALEPSFTLAQAMHRAPIAAASGRVLYGDGLRLGGLT